MRIEQTVLTSLTGDTAKLAPLSAIEPHLVLVFGCVQHFSDMRLPHILQSAFPDARRMGCTTAGEISLQGVDNHTTVVTAIHFTDPDFTVAHASLTDMAHSFAAGAELADKLDAERLKAVLVLGQGVHINGSAMIDGMAERLGKTLPVTGGLAGDDGAFSKTLVLCDEGVFPDRIVAVGFHSERLVFSHGSYGGWQPFGPIRKVTRCVDNVLYELDGEPALEIYKRYLGDYAAELPGSGLLFPFEMLGNLRESTGQIRTILGIDEQAGSLILAGAINSDGYLRLMHAHTNHLVEGAEEAAKATIENLPPSEGQALAILVSCVGRKLVMGGRVDDEVDAVRDIMGDAVVLSGFYSNGEICPGFKLKECSLHNQTMTITWLSERAA